MAEVLGRHSNHGPMGARARALVETASADVRDEPWLSPGRGGATQVKRVMASELASMIADYERGMGCVLLSRKYGIAETTVLAYVKGAGVDVRPRGVEVGVMKELVELRAEGWTLSALGEKYGLTRQTVAARLRKWDTVR